MVSIFELSRENKTEAIVIEPSQTSGGIRTHDIMLKALALTLVELIFNQHNRPSIF